MPRSWDIVSARGWPCSPSSESTETRSRTSRHGSDSPRSRRGDRISRIEFKKSQGGGSPAPPLAEARTSRSSAMPRTESSAATHPQPPRRRDDPDAPRWRGPAAMALKHGALHEAHSIREACNARPPRPAERDLRRSHSRCAPPGAPTLILRWKGGCGEPRSQRRSETTSRSKTRSLPSRTPTSPSSQR